MIDKILRKPKEQLLSPMATRLLRPIHPTVITVVAFGVGLLAGVAAWQQFYLLALALWLLNRILDGLDGTVARMFQKQSDLGSYLDIFLDVIIYAVIPFALALAADTVAGYISLAVLLSSFYINTASWMYLSAILEKRKSGAAAQDELTNITMPGGLIEGTETILFLCLFLLFPSFLVPLFIAMAVLVGITAAQRCVWAIRHL